MMNNRISDKPTFPWLCVAIILVGALLIKPVQDYRESRQGKDAGEPDLMLFTSPALIKRMALGYDRFLADVYWMRTIQYYGRRDQADLRTIRYKNLPLLLDITTTLDPHLLDAYRSGGWFLAEDDPIGAENPDEALRLLNKGIGHNPHEWTLLYDKGFVYYWFMKDYRAAGETWMEASRLPDAPHWMQSLAAMSLSRGGALDIAIALWRQQYHESTRESVRDNARNHLISIVVARDIWRLETLAAEFREQTGRYPETLERLVRGRERLYSTLDPLGTPYHYDPAAGTVSLGAGTGVIYLKIPDIYREQFELPDNIVQDPLSGITGELVPTVPGGL
jgi:tetratricopeptide (TPR) repeat protein